MCERSSSDEPLSFGAAEPCTTAFVATGTRTRVAPKLAAGVASPTTSDSFSPATLLTAGLVSAESAVRGSGAAGLATVNDLTFTRGLRPETFCDRGSGLAGVSVEMLPSTTGRGTETNLPCASEGAVATINDAEGGVAEESTFAVGGVVRAVVGAVVDCTCRSANLKSVGGSALEVGTAAATGRGTLEGAWPAKEGPGIGFLSMPGVRSICDDWDLKSSSDSGEEASGSATDVVAVAVCVPAVIAPSVSEPGFLPTAVTVPSAFGTAIHALAAGRGITANWARSAGFAVARGAENCSSALGADGILESLLPVIFFPLASLLATAGAVPKIHSVSAAPKSPLARVDEVSASPFCRTSELKRLAACILSPRDSSCTRLANVHGRTATREAARQ